MTSRRDTRQEQELRAIIDDIPGNDKCADCEANGPRWASYSLGVFLCTRCASIHRKNSDISKVKSISLDQWTPEQIQKMREVGNTISNYKYNPLREWPIQDDDMTMERFIRDKYERQMFMSQRETANFTPVKSAMKGSAQPIEPGKSSSAVIKYSKELDTLRDMGFTDRSRNVDVLKQVMGDLTAATDALVAMEGTDIKAPPKKPERPRVRFTADTIGGEEKTPQFQAANPFDMWAQPGPSGQQQDFQNPFSSIPPSMYHNQNFVQNVQVQGQAQTQQAMPFMGYQTTGQDAVQQQQYMQPAVPLRSQLTGGQPLRPQSSAQQVPEVQQAQPLRHQLTGRPGPSADRPQAFQAQSQYQAQAQAQYQAQQPTSGPFSQTTPQPQITGQPVFQSQTSQTPQPFQSSQFQSYSQNQHNPPEQQMQTNAYQTSDRYQAGVPGGSHQPGPSQSLKPQLTGMRPKFQPTVDLNSPFNLNTQRQSSPFQTNSPQITGQTPQPQTHSPQRTGMPSQSQNPPFSQGLIPGQQASPQVTGQYFQPNLQNMLSQNRFQTSSPQVTTMPQQGQQPPTGSYNQTSARPVQNQYTGSQGASSDAFGSNFTGPLRAQLTGIHNPLSSQPQPQTNQLQNAFAQTSYPPVPGQYSAPGSTYQPQSSFQPNSSNNGFPGSQSNRSDQAPFNSQMQQPGLAPGRLYSQTTGGQGINPNLPGPSNNNSFPPTSNGFVQQHQQQPQQQHQQQQPQYGQPSMMNSAFRPQQTGYQPQQSQQPSYGAQNMNPTKPFDKAGIMSLYGSQQSMQQQQQQFGQAPPPPPGPPQPSQQQQQYVNGYGAQQQHQPAYQSAQQQGYAGYR